MWSELQCSSVSEGAYIYLKNYQELMNEIITNGEKKMDRTGTGTLSITGATLRYDMSEGLPLVTTKKTAFRLILTELLWFLRGDTNIRFLLENRNYIWVEWPLQKWIKSAEFKQEFPDLDMTDYTLRIAEDSCLREQYESIYKIFCDRIVGDADFAEKWGDCGRAYGAQWRKAFYVNPDTLAVSEHDQLQAVFNELKANPTSRRLVVSSFNPDNVLHAVLPCCHHQFQLVTRENKLDLIFDMRSTDVFAGLPFNLASYGILLMLIAAMAGFEPGELIYHGKDVHIYSNQLEQVNEQLKREPYPLPKLHIKTVRDNFEEYTVDDFELLDYQHHPRLRAPIAI